MSKMYSRPAFRILLAAGVVMMLLCVLFPVSAHAQSDTNRFNVSIVMDASGSMKWTDPDQLRFQAAQGFLRLLTDRGNFAGGVVFSTDAYSRVNPVEINGQEDKDRLLRELEVKPDDIQWTNIGQALMTAVRSLNAYGNPEYPSVIILLSDGNTDMASPRAIQDSLNLQSDAVRLARESDIQIYSIFLNADGLQDPEEMRSISQGTGGKFLSVSSADDLRGAFNEFYDLIYGVHTITLLDSVISPGQEVVKSFRVPEVGVEEVNIFVYGNLGECEIFRPDGTAYRDSDWLLFGGVRSLKIARPVQGEWNVRASGITEEQIVINMTNNTDMVVTLKPEDDGPYISGNEVRFIVELSDSEGRLSSAEGYNGYHANLVVKNALGEVTEYPMERENGHFEYNADMSPGDYHIYVHISGYNIERDSAEMPVTVEEPVDEPQPNRPPEGAQSTLPQTLYVLPNGTVMPTFRRFQFDFSSVVSDPDGDSLRYAVTDSSTFLDDDYTLNGSVLTVSRFRMRQSSFTVRAMDPGGLSCEIELDFYCHSVGWIMAGIFLAGVLIAAVFLLIQFWRRLFVPFMGEVSVTGIYSGAGDAIGGNRGRLPLSDFEHEESGFGRRCYFQASGKPYVIFVSPWPGPRVYNQDDRLTRRVTVHEDDGEVPVFSDANHEHGIYIRFTPIQGVDDDDDI